MKNRRLVPIFVVLLILAALIGGRLFLQAEDQPADVTIQGVVVDMHCYVTRGARDAEHAGCANACIARGVPAGFLADDGTLWVLLGERPISVKEQVKDLASVPSRVTGRPVTRSGVKGLQLKSIEKVAS